MITNDIAQYCTTTNTLHIPWLINDKIAHTGELLEAQMSFQDIRQIVFLLWGYVLGVVESASISLTT